MERFKTFSDGAATNLALMLQLLNFGPTVDQEIEIKELSKKTATKCQKERFKHWSKGTATN